MTRPGQSSRRIFTRPLQRVRRTARLTLKAIEEARVHIEGLTSTKVPRRLRPGSADESGGCELAMAPLPPAPGLSRWLGLGPGGGNDASDKGGDLVLIEFGEDRWDVKSLLAMLRARAALRGRALHAVVVCQERLEPETRRQLSRTRGVRVVEAADDAIVRGLLSVVSALAVPGPLAGDRSNGGRAAHAGAAGVPSVSWGSVDDAQTPVAELIRSRLGLDPREAARAARLLALEAQGLREVESIPWRWQDDVPAVRTQARPQRVVVAGHDLRFAEPVIDALRDAGHAVEIDRFEGHTKHVPQRSIDLARWADVVWCEWALGNLLWHAEHLPQRTRLVTRVHLQEFATAFPEKIRWDRVDSVIFVAEHLRQQALRDLPVHSRRTVTIPNAVMLPEALRASSWDQRFNLGIVGISPARKGMQAALDVLALLRRDDRRFTLSIKGKRPQDYPWLMERSGEREYFDAQEHRISSEPLLQDAITWSPYDDNMRSWYEKVGFVLSTSDFESFHFTVPDGAVNGAIPMLLAWPGSDMLYPASWLHADAASMARAIQAIAADEHRWAERTARARNTIEQAYAESEVTPRLIAQILGV